MNLIIFYWVSIICCSSIVKSQESCLTPQNETGSCIPINDCKPLVDLIEQSAKPLPAFLIDFLQKSFCGLRDGIHYICCSNRHITTTSTTTAATTISTITTPSTITTTATNTTPTDIKTQLHVINEDAIPDVPQFGKIEDVSNHPNLNLLPKYCGRIIESKIFVGKGILTNLEEFPFMALLQYGTDEGLQFYCGGTIINERYILTAAHCVSNPVRKLVSVRVSEHDISTLMDCEAEYCAPPVEDIEVEESILHPWYNRPRFANDIAVIRLQRDIQFKSNIQPICLPINNETQYATLYEVTTAGWGSTEHGTRSNVLLQADLPVVDQNRCQQQYGQIKILESQICAGGVNKSETCNGDSGGPILSSERVHGFDRFIQYGVIAAGHRTCGYDIIPGLYTSIPHYIKWILDELR